jgi:dTDP-4-dehydrorhamnose 3,5-epimerase
MQRVFAQGKLVRCTAGEIFDVAVDVRRGSTTFGRWVGETLSSENFRMLWVPPGFLHGFVVLSDTAHVQYKCTELYHPEDELGVIWNDPEIGIAWPVSAPTLSVKDAALPRLHDVEARLPELR